MAISGSSAASLSDRNNRFSSPVASAGLTFNRFASVLAVAVFLSLIVSFVFTSSSGVVSSDLDIGLSSNSYGIETLRRPVLASNSDPSKLRFDQIRNQADDYRLLALAYAAYARKLKLEKSKLVRVFADLSHSYTDLLSKPVYRALFDSNAESNKSIHKVTVGQLEKEVKEWIKVTRQVIAEAKESFDNQLKIQKLKDTIFAVNEQLTKAKKQE